MFENIYDNLLNQLDCGSDVAMVTCLLPKDDNSGLVEDKYLVTEDDLRSKNLPEDILFLSENISESFEGGLPLTIESNDNFFVIEPFFPKPRLIIFGGGHIAKPLSDLGSNADFEIVLVDDRPMFANENRFPSADNIICDSFENALEKIDFRKNDFVVIVTRGHTHDRLCLEGVLNHDLSYIGAIGSKRRIAGMMDILRDEGFSEEKLNSVCAPIGLDIGAVTPYEIAVSIIAQVIEHRRLKNSGRDNVSNKKFNWPEFDRDVLEEFRVRGEDKALVTIISSKGSVPRKAGAKMIVYPDGRLLGSIGGGCSEAGIITKARDLIRESGYSIEFVDMTGEVAEDIGMVCGGVMNVLIESF